MRYLVNNTWMLRLSLALFLLPFLHIPLAKPVTGKLSDKKVINLFVCHSFEETMPDYRSYNRLIKEYLDNKKIHVNITTFYLDCDTHSHDEELQLAKSFLDTISVKPDLVVLTDDQATYSFLSTKHPLLKNIPIVFTGVNFPNTPLLRQYDNVTGIIDVPDYTKNVEMIEKLLGVKRIRFFYDKTYNGKKVIKLLADQYKDIDPSLNKKLYSFLVDQDSIINEDATKIAHSFLRGNDYSNRPLKTSFHFINMWDDLGRNFMWNISGSFRHSVYLISRYDFSTVNVARIASVPTFSTTNKGFMLQSDIVGGYFTTLDDQVKATCDYLARIVAGEPIANLPIIELPKKFVLDWQVMRRWDGLFKDIPDDIEVLNMPFYVKYKWQTIILSCILGIWIIIIIAYLFFLYRREAKRKRKAQMDLWEEKEFLSLAMEGSNIFAWRYNHEFGEFHFDKEFADTVGLESEHLPLDTLNRMTHDDDVQHALTTFLNVATGNIMRESVRVRIIFNGINYIWYEFRFLNVRGVLGDQSSVIGLVMNIQDQKNKENELIAARDIASKAELKQSFLANMSHEIRTPLNAIIGFSNMLVSDDELSNEDKKEFTHIIDLNCELLLKLINDILEISRLESGNVSLTIEETNLNDLVKDVYDMCVLQTPPNVQFLTKKLSKQILINTDIMRIKQVLVNFVSNAFKFTSQGHVLIGLDTDPLRNEVSMYVEDTGSGISEEHQKMIFDRFYKIDEFAQGTGLGLSICQVIIERLNGRITLDSTLKKGSRFTIVLPYEDTSVELQEEIILEKIPIESELVDPNRPVVLIAEDSVSSYMVLDSILKKHCTLIWAINGKDAVEMVRKRKIDLVLMDIKMHEMDGITALNKIRKINKSIPVIMQTAYAVDENRLLADKAGASAFITKPILSDVLMTEIKRFIEIDN